MSDQKEVDPKFKKHNQKRTKEGIKNNIVGKPPKQRSNISIDSKVWEAMEDIEDLDSKSALIEELIRKELEKKGIKF